MYVNVYGKKHEKSLSMHGETTILPYKERLDMMSKIFYSTGTILMP